MFKLTPNPTFWATVSLTVPGSESPSSIDLEFRHLGQKALAALLRGEGTNDLDVLPALIHDWRGVGTDDGPVKFSVEALAQLLDNYPAASVEMFTAYRRALVESRIKN